MACLCLEYFCFINGYLLSIPEDRFYDIAKAVVLSDNARKDETLRIIMDLIKMHWKKLSIKTLH